MIDYSKVREGRNCVIWTRVSTKYQQENGGSLTTQKELCEEYAQRNGYRIADYFGGKHESAKTPGEMVQKMVKYVKRNPLVSTILVSEFDRFSRCSWQAIKMLQDMRELGIVVIATKYGLDTRTKEGMMMAQSTLSFAELDNQTRTDKFVSGKEQCIRAGFWVLKAPMGYYKEGKSRNVKCCLNNDGKLIAKAFRWKLQGVSGAEIIERLQAHGLRLSRQTLHKVLTNPFYAGKIRHKATGGELIDGNIEPAISYSEFLRVQDILSGRTGKYSQLKQKPELPLTNFVFCAADGVAFTSYTKHKKSNGSVKDYAYYKCNKIGCRTNVSAKCLHKCFIKKLADYNICPDFTARFECLVRDYLQSYSSQAQQERATLKKHITETESAIQSLKVRWALKEISFDVYEAGMSELQSRLDKYTLEMASWNEKLSNSNQMIPVILAIASNISSLWERGSLEIKRKIQKLVFPEGLYWDKENSDYRTPKVNRFFDIINRFSSTCENEKGTTPDGTVPLCG